jgi:RecB family exonuclease
LHTEPCVDYVTFLTELIGAVQSSSYTLPPSTHRDEVLVADVIQARGVPFRAVAVLGLAEGEFPLGLSEDPFLRDADRTALAGWQGQPEQGRAALREHGLLLRPSTESGEVEFFYETITRPSERLLLTRPRLADNGAPWQASPLWEEVCRVSGVEPTILTSESRPALQDVASWPEWMETLAALRGTHSTQDTPMGGRPASAGTSAPDASSSAGPASDPVAADRASASHADPERWAALERAGQTLSDRTVLAGWQSQPEQGRTVLAGWQGQPGPFDGDLTLHAAEFGQTYGPRHIWSMTRLERYRSCPFYFFVANVLHLEPRLVPTPGLQLWQKGNIYHRILERIYQHPSVADRRDLAQLLDALPEVANQVLDQAPRLEGFRVTAWWEQTRQEIVDAVRLSLEALASLPGDFQPLRFEQSFGLGGRKALEATQGVEKLRLHGLIDRIDRDSRGGLRIIDYKSGSVSSYTARSVREGKTLQLPLYALGARDALGAGQAVEGFYWSVEKHEASAFTLSKYEGGPEAAIRDALAAAVEAVRGVRAGQFSPQVPERGCPSWCPVAAFCWRYSPRFEG